MSRKLSPMVRFLAKTVSSLKKPIKHLPLEMLRQQPDLGVVALNSDGSVVQNGLHASYAVAWLEMKTAGSLLDLQ